MSQIPLQGVEAPPRPQVSEDMIRRAAEAVVPNLNIDAGTPLFESSVDDIVKEYRHPMDGYDLAKMLDKWQGWDTDREDMETLDEVNGYVSEYLKEAEKAWVEAWNIQPPYPIGTRIKEGVIAGIYEYSVATYEVKENGCTHEGRFLLVKFEKAVEVTEP